MGIAQKGLLALGVLLLLVLLAAGNCGGGEDEQQDARPTVTESTEGVPDSRARTGNAGQGPQAGPRTRGDEVYTLRVLVLDDVGLPLVGARVAMIDAARPAAGPVVVASADSGGRARLEELGAGDYLLTVSAAGFLSTGAVPLGLPKDAGNEVVAQLRRGARIEGALFGMDGQPRDDGLLRLTATGGGTRTFTVRPDLRGDFQSGALEPGVWELAWLPGEGEAPNPRVTLLRAVSAGEHVRVEVTLPVGSENAVAGRRVGIVETPR